MGKGASAHREVCRWSSHDKHYVVTAQSGKLPTLTVTSRRGAYERTVAISVGDAATLMDLRYSTAERARHAEHVLVRTKDDSK